VTPIRRGGEAGQSTVEVVAVLPLAALLVVAVLQVVLAGVAHLTADRAAAAAAVALVQGQDPLRAARAAVPGWSRTHLRLEIRGPVVSARVDPPRIFPGLAGMLEGRAQAHAGSLP
jgi:hypothetical protein